MTLFDTVEPPTQYKYFVHPSGDNESLILVVYVIEFCCVVQLVLVLFFGVWDRSVQL